MKKYYLMFFVATIIIAACSSSQYTTYRPAGDETNWEINVFYKNGITDNFKVVINDSTVIDASVNVLTKSLEEHGKYRGKNIKLIVSYSEGGLFGTGKGYDAMVFISNELAAKFKF